MVRTELFTVSKKNLAYVSLSLLAVILILLGHQADAASNTYSGGGRACDTSSPPTPYANGAPMARAFYPADGSTVTITTTGAVIKQSPCQTPYREGWVNPSNICSLNSFGQLSGMIQQSDANPYPNNQYNSSCTSTSNQNTTPAPATTSTVSNAQATNITNVTSPPPAANPYYYGNTHNTYDPAVTGKPAYVNNTQTNNPAYYSGVAHTNTAATTAPATATIPDTGASSGSVMALGGFSTLFGTVGHFFYRRRVTS